MGKVVKAVTKPIEKAAKKTVKMVGNSFKSGVRSITDLARGDIVGSLSNLGTAMSGGTIDLTGRGRGMINVNTKKHLASMMGASGVGSVAMPTQQKITKSGLLTQLRQGRGMPGGGSYTETVKNPLGGTSGKTGK